MASVIVEFLNLYLVDAQTKQENEQNRQTLMTAQAICSKRLIEQQSGEYDFTQKFKEDRQILPIFDNKAVKSIPRGRVVVRADGRLCIVAGKWLDEHPKAMSEIRQMFCLPNDATHSYHPDYDRLY